MYSKCSVSTCSQQQQASRWLVSGRLWSRAQFPGGCCCCCLIKVGLFHRQSEVCEGASERPDERTDSSGEKLLLFFFLFFCSSVQDPHLHPPPPLSLSFSLWRCPHALQARCHSLFTELVLGWLSVATFLFSSLQSSFWDPVRRAVFSLVMFLHLLLHLSFCLSFPKTTLCLYLYILYSCCALMFNFLLLCPTFLSLFLSFFNSNKESSQRLWKQGCVVIRIRSNNTISFGVCACLLFSPAAKENTDMTVTETPATFSFCHYELQRVLTTRR